MPDPPASGATPTNEQAPGDERKGSASGQSEGGGDGMEDKSTVERITCFAPGFPFFRVVSPSMSASTCFQLLEMHCKFEHPTVLAPPPPPGLGLASEQFSQLLQAQTTLLQDLSAKQQAASALVQSLVTLKFTII